MWNLLLAVLSAILLILIFPRFSFAWLAPFALAPLLIALAREPRPLRRALVGGAAGIVYWFGVCYWIQFVLAYHGGMGEAGGWASFLLFCVLKALHMALFAWLAGYLMPRPWAVPAVAALWVGIERTHGPLGFAWMALGNAAIDMGVLMRLAPYVGVYGISFAFALLAATLAFMALRRPRRQLLYVVAIPGLFLLPQLPRPEPGREELVSVQPNIALDEEWKAPAFMALRQQLAYLSTEAALRPGEKKPELIVWPEVPAPFYYESDPDFAREADSLARVTRTYFLFGTVAFTADRAPLNSAQLISPEGKPVARYDKMFLVPFGEFVPPLFGWVNKITKEAGDFAPGRQVVLAPVGEHKVGPFICYESVFPHLVRRFALAGADVFVNLSNDGYFGRTAAREQHLLIARMRAAENRRWMIRSTNDGISVSIDPAGRIRRQLEPNVRTAGRFGFNYESSITPYTRYGDWFAWGCLALSLFAVAASQWPSYRKGR
ncbi:MAG: apolipoprotein N-acyltransferase [Bryobacteraceae bacterium]|nr:apolipoprotein N-acyltransferase [Bryobacteraceae bacterium]